MSTTARLVACPGCRIAQIADVSHETYGGQVTVERVLEQDCRVCGTTIQGTDPVILDQP